MTVQTEGKKWPRQAKIWTNLYKEQVKKAFCYQNLFGPFTVWINCTSDLKTFANSQPSALNLKKKSQSLEQFFLTVGRTILVTKYHFLRFCRLNRTLDLLFSCPKNVVAVLYIVRQKHRFEIFIWTMMVRRGEYTYKNSVTFVISYWTIIHFKETVTISKVSRSQNKIVKQ